jgi:diadenosine tetraphosphate (Ap4A) HIT family hydrolase
MQGARVSPTVFRTKGYRFFFFSREERRMHVHVVSGDGEAKFWLEPEFRLARNYRYNQQQLNEIESLIEDHYHELVSAWRHYFGS